MRSIRSASPCMIRRRLMLGAAVAAASSFAAPLSYAQNWPARPVRIVVAAGAGSSVDVFARILGERLSQSLGQPVLVDPRPGANGIIAGQAVATAQKDGYTLLFAGNSALVIAPLMTERMSYDGEKDLVSVAPIVYVPLAVAVPANSEIRSMADLIAGAKKNEMFFATPGASSLSRLIGEVINEKTGTRLVNIAYPSSGPARTDVLAGRIPVLIDGLGGLAPLVANGSLRLLAVSTAERFKGFPDVPSLSEIVPGLAVPGINSLMAPAGTPDEILELMNRKVNEITGDPAIAERFIGLGGEAAQGARQDLDRTLMDQRSTFRRLIEQANIKAN